MRTPKKTRAGGGKKCKTAAAKRADPPSPFSRPWMGRFLADADRSGDVLGALGRHEIGHAEFRQARAADPAFHAACVDLEIAAQASIRSALVFKAQAGNTAAARLLKDGLGAIDPDGRGETSALPPHVAAAMLEAGLRAAGEGPPDPSELCTHLCPECPRRKGW